MTEILRKSIHYVAPKIRSLDISPVDLVTSTLREIARINTKFVAYLDLFSESALKEANVAAREIESGKWRGPLHGIPIGLKDLIDVSGYKTTGGSRLLRHNISTSNATVSDRLRNAGAILIGKHNMVELALGSTGLNDFTGHPRNPWDVERITGGSSSGSGTAIAAGLAYGALGSDTGGSVRMPASLCGIAGLKPTYGLVPRTGILDLSYSMDHLGPMARRSIDCGYILNVVKGHDRKDKTSIKGSAIDFTSKITDGLLGLKVGVPNNFFFDDFVDCEIKTSVIKAIDLLASNGAEIVEIDVPWAEEGRKVNLTIMLAEAAAVHKKNLSEKSHLFSPEISKRILSGFQISPTDYANAQEKKTVLSDKMSNIFKSVNVLITPTVPIKTPKITDCLKSPENNYAGDLPLFTGIFNVTGQPSLSVNCGFSDEGMPIGMMINADYLNEETILRVGHAYEELSGWHKIFPKIQ